jgi:hypothetical protein
MVNETNFDALAEESVETLRDFLSMGNPDENAITKAGIAKSSLSAWTRFKQTQSSLITTKAILIRDLAENKSELLRYLRVSAPELNIVKALSKGKK